MPKTSKALQTLKQALLRTADKLKDAGIEEYQQETVIIFSECLNFTRLELKLNENLVLTDEQQNIIEHIILQRTERKPIQYILKKAWFYGHEFYVQQGVLIPRPETEILVDSVVQLIKNKNKIKIADIGCGSGCIALSIAKIFPAIQIYAVDINQIAINTAKKNAKHLNISKKQICFLQGDKFEPLKDKGKFDILVSNPPYIPSNDIKTLETEIEKYEPITAFNGGEDGLDFYRYFAKESQNFLKINGYLCVEIGANQKTAIQNIFEQNNLKIEAVIKDLNNINRVMIACL